MIFFRWLVIMGITWLVLICFYYVGVYSVKNKNNLLSIPDISFKNVPEILHDFGYDHEAHYVTTEDGYILTVFRITSNTISSKRSKIPMLLTHVFSGSSADYIIQGPGKALALLLADNHYDVWLMNCRGTIYSLNHTTIPHWETKFWDFTWHEMGIYDLPSTIDYILKVTESNQVIQVGMSQGTTALYVMLSERPEYNAKVKLHIGFTPSAFLCHTTNALLRSISIPEKHGVYSTLIEQIGSFNCLPELRMLPLLVKLICTPANKVSLLCQIFFKIVVDSNMLREHSDELMIASGFYPAGASIKIPVHFAQLVNECVFRPYKTGNQSVQNYKLENIKIPMYSFYGEADTIQNPKDTKLLEKNLRNKNIFIPVKHFGHADFILHPEATEKVYLPVLKIIEKYV